MNEWWNTLHLSRAWSIRQYNSLICRLCNLSDRIMCALTRCLKPSAGIILHRSSMVALFNETLHSSGVCNLSAQFQILLWRHNLSEVYLWETNARYYYLTETIVYAYTDFFWIQVDLHGQGFNIDSSVFMHFVVQKLYKECNNTRDSTQTWAALDLCCINISPTPMIPHWFTLSHKPYMALWFGTTTLQFNM